MLGFTMSLGFLRCYKNTPLDPYSRHKNQRKELAKNSRGCKGYKLHVHRNNKTHYWLAHQEVEHLLTLTLQHPPMKAQLYSLRYSIMRKHLLIKVPARIPILVPRALLVWPLLISLFYVACYIDFEGKVFSCGKGVVNKLSPAVENRGCLRISILVLACYNFGHCIQLA